jgi:fructose-bisphosphate aldolase class II
MPLVSGRILFERANELGIAVGGFNFSNMEFLRAILDVAQEEFAPVFVQTTESAISYAGVEYLSGMVRAVADKYSIPFALHLDHGRSPETILLAIRNGYTSVMIDFSDRPYEENVEVTKRVVSLCTPLGISVEAELGILGGVEDEVQGTASALTDPDLAEDFMLKTGATALAPAVGTSHGPYKVRTGAKIDFDLLRRIKEKTGAPLVLHGASGVYYEYVSEINRFGGKIESAGGIPDGDIQTAVGLGINKVNTDTDLRLAFIAGLRRVLTEERTVTDPRKLISPAMEQVREVIRRRIRLLGSSGCAEDFLS